MDPQEIWLKDAMDLPTLQKDNAYDSNEYYVEWNEGT